MASEPGGAAVLVIEAQITEALAQLKEFDEAIHRVGVAEQQLIQTLKTVNGEQNKLVRVGSQWLDVTAGQAEGVKLLGRAYEQALKPSEKTALMIERLKKETSDATKKLPEYTKAIGDLGTKMEDQAKREAANKGRSLSMLFDEQNKILALLPGRIGQVAQAYGALSEGASKAAEGLSKVVRNAEGGYSAIGLQVAILGTLTVAAAAAAVSIGVLAHGAYESIAAFDDMAQSAGLSTTELSKFRLLATYATGGISDFAKGMERLAIVQQDAAAGNEKAAAALEKIGGTAADTTSQLLLKVVGTYERMGNTAERAALASDLFGAKLARNLTPALNKGELATFELMDRTEELGAVIHGDALDAANAYQQSLKELGVAFDALKLSAAPAIPILKGAVNEIRDMVTLLPRTVHGLANLGETWSDTNKEIQETPGFMASAAAAWAQGSTTARDLHFELENVKQAIIDNDDAYEAFQEEQKEQAEAFRAGQEAAKEHAAMLKKINDEITKGVQKEFAAQQKASEAAVKAHNEALTEQLKLVRGIDEAMIDMDGPEEIAATKTAFVNFFDELDKGGEAAQEQIAKLSEEMEKFTLAIGASQQAIGTLYRFRADQARDTADEIADLEDKLQGDITDGQRATYNAQLSMLKEQQAQQLAVAQRLFRLNQLAAYADIAINTAVAITKAYAQLGPAAGTAAAIALTALGGIQAYVVSQQKPPKYHGGGVVTDGPMPAGGYSGEVAITAQKGEAVVSAQDARNVGGPWAALDLIKNAGRGQAPAPVYLVHDRRILGYSMEDDVLAGGRMREVLQSGRARVGSRRR